VPPPVPDEWRFAYDAFNALKGDRAIGFGGIGPISFIAVDRYAIRYGIEDPEEFERFHDLIRAMDAAYMADVNKPRKT
jgi:hypothetical protein